MAKTTIAPAVLAELRLIYPDARTELNYKNSFELLVATILSAQSTDRAVNAATPALFARFPDAKSLGAADINEVESLIKTIGLYRNKARFIIAAAKELEKYGGVVPNDPVLIEKLPGVGRKTSNVVLANAYNRPAIGVDTHVSRLSKRLGFSVEKDPHKIERDLSEIFAEKDWIFIHHALVLHGRYTCLARKPKCSSCVLTAICPRIGV